MRVHVVAILGAFALSALGPGASAKTVVHQPAKFRIRLPDDFVVVEQTGSRLLARSRKGNIHVYARTEIHDTRSYDFDWHLERWEIMAKRKKVYSTLRRIGRHHIKHGRNQVVYYRVYEAKGKRRRTQQPYRILVMAALHIPGKRVYTLAVASHKSVFAKNRGRIMSIVNSFSPYDLPTMANRVRPRSVQRVSLRGKLIRRGAKVVRRR